MRDTKHFRLDDPWFFESELIDLRGRLEQVRASIAGVEAGAGSITVDTARIIPPWEQRSVGSTPAIHYLPNMILVAATTMISCGLILLFVTVFGSRSQLWGYALPTLLIGFAGLGLWGLMHQFLKRSRILPLVKIERLRQLHCPESESLESSDSTEVEA